MRGEDDMVAGEWNQGIHWSLRDRVVLVVGGGKAIVVVVAVVAVVVAVVAVGGDVVAAWAAFAMTVVADWRRRILDETLVAAENIRMAESRMIVVVAVVGRTPVVEVGPAVEARAATKTTLADVAEMMARAAA